MTKVLICGGRDFGSLPPFDPPYSNYEEALAKQRREVDLFLRVMSKLLSAYNVERIIEGGARGADRLAQRYAIKHDIPLTTCKADWNTHGNKAGPIRNQQMLDLGVDLVVAFPGSSGTADMVRRSKAAGVKVIEVPKV